MKYNDHDKKFSDSPICLQLLYRNDGILGYVFFHLWEIQVVGIGSLHMKLGKKKALAYSFCMLYGKLLFVDFSLISTGCCVFLESAAISCKGVCIKHYNSCM